jgi:hypothetical protein
LLDAVHPPPVLASLSISTSRLVGPVAYSSRNRFYPVLFIMTYINSIDDAEIDVAKANFEGTVNCKKITDVWKMKSNV